MDIDAKTFALLTITASIIVGLIWEFFGDWKDTFDDFWEELNWKDDEEDSRDKPKSKRRK